MSTHTTILSTKKLKPGVTRQALLAGFTVIDYDFISIVFTGAVEHPGETLVFTSRNAVKAFEVFKEKAGDGLPHYKVYCLEGETLQALQEIEGIDIVATAKDALSLAHTIIAGAAVSSVSFICGHQRRDELPGLLSRHGIAVQEMRVYKTLLTGHPVQQAYAGVLFFSPTAVESFFQTNVLAAGVACFCIGGTTAAAVREHTDNPVLTAAATTQESMIEAIQDFFKKNKAKRNDNIERRHAGGSETGAIKK